MKGVCMIKFDASKIQPVKSRVLAMPKNVKKAVAVVLPAALGVDAFVSSAPKASDKKKDYEACSDFCMEISG